MALESGNHTAFLWSLPYYIEIVIALGKFEKAAELIGFTAPCIYVDALRAFTPMQDTACFCSHSSKMIDKAPQAREVLL
jgi:hypothetical protein